MIQGARFVFHTPDFTIRMQGAEMALWTVIDGNIYLERDPFYALHPPGREFIKTWYDQISRATQHPRFPKKM
jgi:hypothetical protein